MRVLLVNRMADLKTGRWQYSAPYTFMCSHRVKWEKINLSARFNIVDLGVKLLPVKITGPLSSDEYVIADLSDEEVRDLQDMGWGIYSVKYLIDNPSDVMLFFPSISANDPQGISHDRIANVADNQLYDADDNAHADIQYVLIKTVL